MVKQGLTRVVTVRVLEDNPNHRVSGIRSSRILDDDGVGCPTVGPIDVHIRLRNASLERRQKCGQTRSLPPSARAC